MAEPEPAKKTRKQEDESKQSARQRDSQSAPELLHSWDSEVPSLTDTPFEPSTDLHAALLSGAGSESQKTGFVLGLQQTYGNRYVQRLARSVIQAKLTLSQPGDVYEQEADEVARAATNGSTIPVHRQPEEEVQAKPVGSVQRQAEEEEEVQARPVDSVQRQAEEEEEVQAKPVGSVQRQAEEEEEIQARPVDSVQRQAEEEEEIQARPVDSVQRQGAEEEEELQTKPAGSQPAPVANNVETRINAARGTGQSLDDVVREPMEHVLGADFSNVHVHTDSEADVLNQHLSARAFTTGRDIFFRQGTYNPVSGSGRELIAHELAHVVQQTGGNGGTPPTQPSLHRSDDIVQRELLPVQYRMLGTTREEYNGFALDVRTEVEELVNNSRWVAAQRALARARATIQQPPSVGPVPQVKQPPAQQVVNKPPPPKPPRPIYREVSFNPKQIPADGVTTTQASVKTVPTNRAATWSIEGNAYGATISPGGLITPGKGIADQEKAQVRVKATDVREPVVSNTGELTLMEPKYYQAVQDYDTFTAKTYKFDNFQTGVQGLFNMEYQPLAKLAAVTLKVKFEIKDDPKKNNSLFDDLQRKLNYPYYREQFSDIVTDAWSKRYQFRNIREPQSVWGKLNPVTVPVRVQEVNAGEQFLIKLDLTQEKGAAVARPKKGSRYARLYKGSLQEKQNHFQKRVLRGEDDRIKAISPGASPGNPAIQFGNGSKAISKADQDKLKFLSTYLRGISVPPMELTIEGHSSAGDETNLIRMVFGGLTGAKNIISQQRAEAVRDEIKTAGGVGTTHKLSTADAGRTGASKVVITPQIQEGFTNTYVTVAHEVGHMFGLADEYYGPKTAYGHHKLAKKAFGLRYADALVAAPLDVGKQGGFADVMATGRDVRMHNYVTFWEALYQTTSQKATVPAIKFGEADWRFVGYSE